MKRIVTLPRLGTVLVLFGFLLVFFFVRARLGAFDKTDAFYHFFLGASLALLLVLIASFLFLFSFRKKNGERLPLEHVFLLVVAVLGVLYNTLVPAMAVPDEDYHIPVASSVASVLMGHGGTGGGITLRSMRSTPVLKAVI